MIDCPNCANSYEKDLERCPTCNAENPLVARTDDVFQKTPIKGRSNSKGIIIGAAAAGAAIVAILFLAGSNILDLLNPSRENTNPNADTTGNDDQANAPDDNTKDPEQDMQPVVQNLLSTRIFLSPDDSRTFQINIPNEDVTKLEGTVKVSGGRYVSVQFLKPNGASYCVQPSQCSYDVYVDASGSRDSNNDVDIPVNIGDALRLVVTNSESSELQIVDINLYVSYLGSASSIDEPIVNEQAASEIISVVQEETAQESVDDEPAPVESIAVNEEASIEDYREYALQLINEDREDAGMPPVELSDNEAAQVHAEDVLATRYISHWMTNGEKPYMTYTRYGGTGNVGQNVAMSGDTAYYEDCISGYYYCEPMDIYSEIEDHEYGMIYEDAVCCDNGHRDNILDPNHTHVSIGIAYDDYTFVMVQNFEDNYVEFTKPITTDNKNIQLIGRIPAGSKIDVINIFYDDTPTSKTYQNNKFQSSYGVGEMVAGVTEPGYYYEDIVTVTASKWYENNQSIDIRFSLSSLDDEPGVYTIVTWLEDSDGDQFPVTSYSVFVE